MDYAEIIDQWGERFWLHPDWMQAGLVRAIATTAIIAWNELASTPGPAQQDFLTVAARWGLTRATKPRTILRALIQRAQNDYDWVPTEQVMRAAGMRIPRPTTLPS